MLKESPKLLHWNYFLVLETDLENFSRYIEFTKDNYKTYSQEMARLLLTAGSVKRRDILRVNRRIHLRVGADECSYIFEKDILRVSSENRLNEA